MRVPTSKTVTPDRPPTARRERYHHGNLHRALIEATLEMIEERGVEEVTLREVAKRLGVSPSAPFRHFTNKTALLTAVAEQAITRLAAEVASMLSETAGADPLVRFEAIGLAYLRWALNNPTHFQIVSSRRLIDFESSATLQDSNDEIRAIMRNLLAEAVREGQLPADADIDHIQLAGRALVYGLARMAVDGHFAEWSIGGETSEQTMRIALAVFIREVRAGGSRTAADNSSQGHAGPKA
jgi:AcrR family transcriptional regulator